MWTRRLWANVAGVLLFAGCAEQVTSPVVAPRVEPLVPTLADAALVIGGTNVVKASSMDGWVLAVESGTGSTGGFATGPTGQPLGSGSAELTITAGAQGHVLALPGVFGGSRLDQMTLSYSTYRQTADAGNNLAIALQFNLDHDVTALNDGNPVNGLEDFQGRLVYEPYQTFGGGVTQGAWQAWTAHSDKWWRTTSLGTRATLPFPNDCVQATPCTVAEILSKWPDAGISAAFDAIVLKAGSGWTVPFTGNVDQLVIGVNAVTTTFNFEPETQCTTTCYVNAATGSDAFGGDTPASAKLTIQAALNQVSANGTVRVFPGTYNESAPGSAPTSIPGTYQFGLFFGSAKAGITLMGVDATDTPITNAASTLATINTDATNNFGFSGIFVEAANTTIRGVTVGPNLSGNNKTIEIVADNFTLQYAATAVPGGAIYISEFDPPATAVSSYHILDNKFTDATQIAISSGAGQGGLVAGREITGNTFALGSNTWPAISFNGTGGVPWYTKPVGGAIITGNTFSGGGLQYIRARGTYTEAEFDWQAHWNGNTYDKGTVALVTETPFDVRTFSYVSGPYTFTNVRRIGTTVQGEVDNTVAADVVLAKAGSYPESVTIPRALTLKGAGIGSTVLQGTAGADTGIALAGGLSNVTVQQLTAQGYDLGIHMLTGPLSNITVRDVATINNTRHGIWVQAFGVTNMAFTRVNSSGNNSAGGLSGRGIWMINGIKTNISITDGTFNNNGLVGIDLSDGSVTGTTITGNTVTGNGDSGIGVLGAEGPGANLVSNNVVTNNGRYGIEIKIPTGNGAASGAGSVVVSNNTVTRTIAATDARDYAGIAVFRRSGDPAYNADQPTGVVVTGNTVNGFLRKPAGSTGDGFGIVVEGTGHIVTKNIVSGNDVGIQIQSGNTANVQSTLYFDRGDAAPSGALINRNSIIGHSDHDLQNVGAGLTDATCNWFGSAAGPTPSKISGSLDTSQWLTSSNLNGACSNQAPIITLGGPFNGVEASSISFTATAVDPEAQPLTYDWDFGDGAHASTLNASHAYVDNGTYTVTLTVSDGSNSPVATGSATVSNAVPVPNAGADVTVIKSTALPFTPSFTDAGVLDATWIYTVQWGDGSPVVSRTTTSQGTQPTLTHSYDTPGTYTRRLIVTDKDGGSSFDDAIITVVNNSPPVAVINGPYTGNEGTGVVFSSAGTNDPDGNPITYKWSFGDASTSAGVNPTRIYTDNGVYTVTLIVKDNKGGADTATTTATIGNVAPTATFVAPATVTEGQTATLAMNSARDKGAADRPTLQFAFDCGTGVFSAFGATTNTVCPALPDQTPPRILRAQVKDKDGGVTTYQKNSTVTNAGPVVTFTPTSPTTITVGGSVSVQGSFTDNGVNDQPWTYKIVWGDGKPSTTGTVSSQGALPIFSHTYTATGTFLPKLTVKDKDGKSTTSAAITVTVTP